MVVIIDETPAGWLFLLFALAYYLSLESFFSDSQTLTLGCQALYLA